MVDANGSITGPVFDANTGSPVLATQPSTGDSLDPLPRIDQVDEIVVDPETGGYIASGQRKKILMRLQQEAREKGVFLRQVPMEYGGGELFTHLVRNSHLKGQDVEAGRLEERIFADGLAAVQQQHACRASKGKLVVMLFWKNGSATLGLSSLHLAFTHFSNLC